MIKPLDDVEHTIQLIESVTGTPGTEVRQRLRDEVHEIGTNVHRSLTAQQIPMYVASQELDTFYKDSDAFLYETTIWNTCDAKQAMRNFITSRLKQFKPNGADIFCFGDGLGFDSTWLASEGHRTRYYEPSLRCQEYAKEVFRQNNVDVAQLNQLDEIPPNSLDALVCLDVLEHVPQPQELVKLFHQWLKPDGLLFVHAPFWCLHWTRSTHLKENRHFSGDLRKLYHTQGFSEIDASIFWDPILLQKSDSPTPIAQTFGGKSRIRLGQAMLAIGRHASHIHTAIARRIARAPKTWVEALK